MQIETTSLGDRSDLPHDGVDAAVVDPQRDIDRVVARLEARDLTLPSVFDTHVHNDYATGGFELSRRFGAAYHLHGHASTYLSYVADDSTAGVTVFAGGSLLNGSVGRTGSRWPGHDHGSGTSRHPPDG